MCVKRLLRSCSLSIFDVLLLLPVTMCYSSVDSRSRGKLMVVRLVTCSNCMCCVLVLSVSVTLYYYVCFLGHQDPEGINKSLETLCLSMTNHALEGKWLRFDSLKII